MLLIALSCTRQPCVSARRIVVFRRANAALSPRRDSLLRRANFCPMSHVPSSQVPRLAYVCERVRRARRVRMDRRMSQACAHAPELFPLGLGTVGQKNQRGRQ